MKYTSLVTDNLPNTWQIFRKVVITPFNVVADMKWSKRSLAVAVAMFPGLLTPEDEGWGRWWWWCRGSISISHSLPDRDSSDLNQVSRDSTAVTTTSAEITTDNPLLLQEREWAWEWRGEEWGEEWGRQTDSSAHSSQHLMKSAPSVNRCWRIRIRFLCFISMILARVKLSLYFLFSFKSVQFKTLFLYIEKTCRWNKFIGVIF